MMAKEVLMLGLPSSVTSKPPSGLEIGTERIRRLDQERGGLARKCVKAEEAA